MTRIETFPGREILSTPLSEPWRIFPLGNVLDIKARFRLLAKIWHPDRPEGDRTVFEHITALRSVALNMVDKASWGGPAAITPWADEVPAREAPAAEPPRPKDIHDVIADDIGEIGLTHDRVVYRAPLSELGRVIDATFALGCIASELGRLDAPWNPFPEISSLPRMTGADTGPEDSVVLELIRPDSTARLSSLWEISSDTMGSRSFLRIMAQLLDIAKFLKSSGLMHGDISPDTIFISPGTHRVYLLGGWWMASHLEREVKSFSRTAMSVVCNDVLARGVADARVDIECIRRLGHDILTRCDISEREVAPELMRWFQG